MGEVEEKALSWLTGSSESSSTSDWGNIGCSENRILLAHSPTPPPLYDGALLSSTRTSKTTDISPVTPRNPLPRSGGILGDKKPTV